MVQWWGRGRTETWPPGGAQRPRASGWPRRLAGFSDAFVARLRGWAVAEVIPGRLLPWLPVAYGLGIAVYFTAEREPAWWAAIALTAVCSGFAFLTRRRAVAYPVALALTAAAAGFATATLKSVHVAHPILQAPAGNVEIAGYVEVREERERAVDLRLSHGDRGRRGVLRDPCPAGADPEFREPASDQEMGRAGGAHRGGGLPGDLRRRGRDATRLHHDGDRADRCDGGSRVAHAAHACRRGVRGADPGAAGRGAPELPDVVCRDARSDRRL